MEMVHQNRGLDQAFLAGNTKPLRLGSYLERTKLLAAELVCGIRPGFYNLQRI
jgi:hypothetical protein